MGPVLELHSQVLPPPAPETPRPQRTARVSARMEPLGALSFLFVVVVVVPFGCAASVTNATIRAGLRVGFYGMTCPRVEEVVREAVDRGVLVDPGVAAGLVRLAFHDCFVRGCDASILLDAMPAGELVEKDSPFNGDSLRGLDIIDNAKQRLEDECPGIVSCADIIAFATRDAAVHSGLPTYSVPAGRRDGTISLAADVSGNLPSPRDSVDIITSKFAAKGFTHKEMVTLSGAHSIGGAHCPMFDYRLYSFQPGQPQDPTMEPGFAGTLKLQCPAHGSLQGTLFAGPRVPFNPVSPLTLDNLYYVDLLNGRGLLPSDQALMGVARTRRVVRHMAAHPDRWARKFTAAMVKLGTVGVLTGREGEVRSWCRFAN